MHVVALFLATHGEHVHESLLGTLLHLLHPAHWAVPVLAIVGGLLAVHSVRRGLQRDVAERSRADTGG